MTRNKKNILGAHNRDKPRCSWCGSDPLYVRYHDTEWGVPVHDDRKHFGFLMLEGAQAGLSWITILRKRENYRKAFANFNAARVARFGARRPAVAPERRHRAQSPENRGRHHQCARVPGSAEGIRFVRPLRVALRRRAATCEPPAFLETAPRAYPGIRRIVEGFEIARLPFRGADHHLCPHAGSWDGERPPGVVLPPPRTGAPEMNWKHHRARWLRVH